MVCHVGVPPLRAVARAAAPPGRRAGAKGQQSPQGIFNKRRSAGHGNQQLRNEWRYQLQGPSEPKPSLDELVVVEGFNDMVAVARAVDAEVAASRQGLGFKLKPSNAGVSSVRK